MMYFAKIANPRTRGDLEAIDRCSRTLRSNADAERRDWFRGRTQIGDMQFFVNASSRPCCSRRVPDRQHDDAVRLRTDSGAAVLNLRLQQYRVMSLVLGEALLCVAAAGSESRAAAPSPMIYRQIGAGGMSSRSASSALGSRSPSRS
jgi:hypothetical protein